MNLLLDIVSVGALWLLASFPLAVLVGRWLEHGSGRRYLDSWVED